MNPVIIEGVTPWLHKLLIGNVRFSGLLPSGNKASVSGLFVNAVGHISGTWIRLSLLSKCGRYSST
jgi:hypothetical protein